MGSYVAKPMKEAMLDTQKTQISRQVAMQDAMRERQMAFMIARQREMLNWTGSFAAVVSSLCLAGFAKTKNPGILFPILPMGFGFGYMYDMAYGDKMQRILVGAEKMMQEERQYLSLPWGPPTFNEISMRADVASSKENKLEDITTK